MKGMPISRRIKRRETRGTCGPQVDAGKGRWVLEQTVTDPDGHNDWTLRLVVDLKRSREAAKVILGLAYIRPI